MICPKCQSENPAVNRFCGMCGSRLQEMASADPARPSNGTDQGKTTSPSVRRPFIVSTTAMADVTAQMLNTRVVLPSPSIASATHSGYSTPLRPRVDDIAHGENLPEPEIAPVDPNDEPFFSNQAAPAQHEGTVHEFDLESPEEQEAEEWLERTVAEHEAHMPPPRVETPGSILNLSAPVEPVIERRVPVEEAPVEVRTEPERPTNTFLQFDQPTEAEATNVSGPSFLGLGSAYDDKDYLLDDQTESHTGRNLVLLAVIAIVAVLGFLEWRASNRGESTNPVDVLHLKLPQKGKHGQAEVVQPTAGGSSDPNSNEIANNSGKPDLIAEPTQPAMQASNATTNTQPATTTGAAPNPTPADGNPPTTTASSGTPAPGTPAAPQPTSAQSASANAHSAVVPAAKSPAAPQQLAKNTPPPAATKPAPLPQSDSDSKPKATKPAANVTKNAAPEPAVAEADPTLSAGSFELQKGKAAGATEEGRMWLWKAVSKGNGEAPVLLADMYLQGRGVEKDCEQAVLLLNAAAKKANPRARTKLGSLYATGECVPQDRVQAYKWMTQALAVNPGSEWIEKNRQQLLSQMTASERQRAAAVR